MITAAPPMAAPLGAPVEQSPPEWATRLLEPTWTGPAWSARAGGAARAIDPAARPASRARFRAMAMTWLPGPARPLEWAVAAFDLGWVLTICQCSWAFLSGQTHEGL